jgi:large subunit ribosomal protein L18
MRLQWRSRCVLRVPKCTLLLLACGLRAPPGRNPKPRMAYGCCCQLKTGTVPLLRREEACAGLRTGCAAPPVHCYCRIRLPSSSLLPRLSHRPIFSSRSNNHIYGQIIDDSKHAVVSCASTMEKEVREAGAKTNNKEAAAEVGKRLAERALAKGITKVVFDRNGRPYHGRIAALADGAREGGLAF